MKSWERPTALTILQCKLNEKSTNIYNDPKRVREHIPMILCHIKFETFTLILFLDEIIHSFDSEILVLTWNTTIKPCFCSRFSWKCSTFCSYANKKNGMWYIAWVVRASKPLRCKVSCALRNTDWVNCSKCTMLSYCTNRLRRRYKNRCQPYPKSLHRRRKKRPLYPKSPFRPWIQYFKPLSM